MLVKQCLAMRRAGLIGPQREVTMIRPPETQIRPVSRSSLSSFDLTAPPRPRDLGCSLGLTPIS
jgi:hypothetical protein